MEYFLEGKDVTKYFGGLAAVDGVNFHLIKGEIFALIGPNGAGKTTLFNMIAGVYKLDSGEICFNSESLNNLRPDQRCKMGIARTFQISKPLLNLSVIENVTVGSYFGTSQKQTLEEVRERAEEVIEKVGLKGKINSLARHLTLVERKLMELARALATRPKLLLLDEVIAGLNPTETMEMVKIILDLRNSGLTIFMIEHVIKVVMMASDRVLVLHYGKKIAEGTPQQVVENSNVIQAYLGGEQFA